MTGSLKRNALILLGLVLLSLVVLAASLPQLVFQPGLPLPRFENDQVVFTPLEAEPLIVIQLSEFVKVFFILMLVGTWVYILYQVLRRVDFRNFADLIQPIWVSGLIVGVIFFLALLILPNSGSELPVALPVPVPAPLVTAPLDPPPPLLLWVVGLGLLAIGILIGVWIFVPTSAQPTTLDLLGLEAARARQALQTGQELKKVILTCYRQMEQAVGGENGLERQASMTTREFENLLEAAGLPPAPVHQLTQLFEAVRYGNWQPNPLDEEKALQALDAIIADSQALKTGKSLP